MFKIHALVDNFIPAFWAPRAYPKVPVVADTAKGVAATARKMMFKNRMLSSSALTKDGVGGTC